MAKAGMRNKHAKRRKRNFKKSLSHIHSLSPAARAPRNLGARVVFYK
jgi:hypothetical protein